MIYSRNNFKMDVSIIIVNYNTLKITSECIDSITEKVTDIEYEIILVDNASTDGSKEYFEKDNRINYIYSSENIGFGRANNLGAKGALGKYLLFLNPDTILINNAPFILFQHMENHPDCGACGGNLYDELLNPSHSFERTTNGIFIELDCLSRKILRKLFFGKNFIHNHTGRLLDVPYICGADLMIKKKVFNSINGFCPDFFMYYEETDLCHRVKSLRLKIHSVPDAKIQHLEGKSFNETSSFNYNKWVIMSRSRKLFLQRNYPAYVGKLTYYIMKFNFILTTLIHRPKINVDYLKLYKLYRKA